MSNQDKQNILKGELLDFGNAPYQDNPQNTPSYFVQLRHDDGIIDKKWGVDLERAIQDSGVKKGDTIILKDLGKQPVNIADPNNPSQSKTVHKNLWEVEKYEPVLDLKNVIEHDSEQEQQKQPTAYNTKQKEEAVVPNQTQKTPDLAEFDWLPDNIKNNYVAITKNRYLTDQKTNYYDKNDKDQVNIAFEDRSSSLHTSRQDEKTIYAMLDMAQAKNWTAIKLKGTEEFKQRAWLEASLRGMKTSGYEPSEKDLAELQVKQTERTVNQVEMTAQKPLEPTQQAVEVEQEKSPVPEMTEGYLKSVTPHRLNETLVDVIAKNAQEYNRQNQKNIDDLQNNNKDQLQDEPQQISPVSTMSDSGYINEEMALYEQQQLAKWEAERLSFYEQNEHTYTNEDMERYEQQIYDQWEDNHLAEQIPPTQEELLDIDVQIQEQSHVQHATKEINQEPIPQKSVEDIKKDIRQIFQDGYKDGLIKSRDELVEVLKERGFEVKENDKSIRVSLPNSDQAVNLKGEVFTKGYDAIKSLKERLEPDILQKTYPNLKDSDLVHITAYKNKLVDDYKDGKPKALQASLVQLEDSIKQMANGKEMNFPALPVNEIKPDIEVRTTDNHDKSRQV